MSQDTWGKRPRKPKQKRDSWAKPKRGRRKKDFGAVAPKDRRRAKKEAKAWGKPKGGAQGILAKFGGEVRSGGWLQKFFKRPRGYSLREYYQKLDRLEASQIQAGVREQLAERYQSEIDRAETVGQKLTRWAEGILRRRLSPGQAADVRDIAREVITPNRVVAFVTNLFK